TPPGPPRAPLPPPHTVFAASMTARCAPARPRALQWPSRNPHPPPRDKIPWRTPAPPSFFPAVARPAPLRFGSLAQTKADTSPARLPRCDTFPRHPSWYCRIPAAFYGRPPSASAARSPPLSPPVPPPRSSLRRRSLPPASISAPAPRLRERLVGPASPHARVPAPVR